MRCVALFKHVSVYFTLACEGFLFSEEQTDHGLRLRNGLATSIPCIKKAQGLLTGKKAVVTTSGGRHKGSPRDMVTPYLCTVLGIDEVEFVYAEAQGMGEEAQQTGLKHARNQLDALVKTV